jgi:hypothetical protein
MEQIKTSASTKINTWTCLMSFSYVAIKNFRFLEDVPTPFDDDLQVPNLPPTVLLDDHHTEIQQLSHLPNQDAILNQKNC